MLRGNDSSVAVGMDTLVHALSWTSAPWLPIAPEFGLDEPGGSSQACVSTDKTSRTLFVL